MRHLRGIDINSPVRTLEPPPWVSPAVWWRSSRFSGTSLVRLTRDSRCPQVPALVGGAIGSATRQPQVAPLRTDNSHRCQQCQVISYIA